MSEIDNGIKQPLRWYDDVSKQNWRQPHVNNGGLTDEMVVICPENAIIPFQIRRRRSARTITTFDLYTFDPSIDDFSYDIDVFSIIDAPLTASLNVIQMETADNIVWNPTKDFLIDLPCGLHYLHMSDGSVNWYSEVFRVVAGYRDNTKVYVAGFSDATVTGSNTLSKDGTAAGRTLKSNKPF